MRNILLEVGTSCRDKQDFFAMQQSYYCSLGRKRRKGSFKENFTFRDSTKRVYFPSQFSCGQEVIIATFRLEHEDGYECKF